MDQININTLYQEIQKSFPHTEFLKDRLTFRIWKILQEHNFFSESSALVINRWWVYLLHQIPIDILLEWVSSFLKNELSCIESDYVEKLQGWIRTKLLSVIESWFNISTATEISEADLMKIFAYRITPDTLPFFIISNQGTNTPKRKFKVDNESDDTEICYSSHWFALIRPNDSSHIIIPSERIWIRFDSKKQFLLTESDHRVWWLWWWIFQLDKNLGKEIVHTQVDTGSMLWILEKISL
jgi:hypothetical protein